MILHVTFEGGPHHGMGADVARLDDIWLYFDERQRQVIAYVRDELTFNYSLDVSKGLTSKYDAAYATWAPRVVEPSIDKLFSDEAIEWNPDDEYPSASD